MSEEEDIKVIFVGEPGTGKTSLINVSVGEKFERDLLSTTASSFSPKKFNKNGKVYTLNLWDTAGQERFRSMTKLFIKNSKIVILVYAIDSEVTFEGLKEFWLKTIKESLGDEPIYAIVGNKSDLFLKEKIQESVVREYAQNLGIKFTLASAKESPKDFVVFLESLLDDYLSKKGIVINNNKAIKLSNQDNNGKQKKKCCI